MKYSCTTAVCDITLQSEYIIVIKWNVSRLLVTWRRSEWK